MSAANFMPNMGSNPLARPVAKSGRVVYNAIIDTREIQLRQVRGKRKQTQFAASREKHTVQEHLPLIMSKQRRLGATPSGIGATQRQKVQVTADMNGLGEQGQPTWKIVEQSEWGGLADGQAHHEPGNPAYLDFATVFGGLNTTINTGNEVIHAGEQVYWDAQNPDGEQRPYGSIQGVSGDTILWALRPYKADKVDVTVKSIREALQIDQGREEALASREHARGPLADAAVHYRRHGLNTMMLGVVAAIRAGLVTPTEEGGAPEPLGRPQQGFTEAERLAAVAWNRRENAAANDTATGSAYVNQMTRLWELAGAIGAGKGGQGPPRKQAIGRLPQGAVGQGKDLDQMMMDMYFGQEEYAHVMPSRGAKRGAAFDVASKVHAAQLSNVHRALAAHNAGRQFITRRIIGTALSHAEPGDAFDLVLGKITS